MLSGQYLQEIIRRIIGSIQEHQGRAMGFAVASFPMTQRAKADTKGYSKLVLGQACLFPHLFHIHLLGSKYLHFVSFALTMGESFFKATFYTFK